MHRWSVHRTRDLYLEVKINVFCFKYKIGLEGQSYVSELSCHGFLSLKLSQIARNHVKVTLKNRCISFSLFLRQYISR